MADKKSKPRGLGRGLSALMADVAVEPQGAKGEPAPRADLSIPIEKIAANPNQPRRDFDPDDLRDLSSSIREKGVIQPLIVRPAGKDRYEIVAGERRWRAAQMARLHEVPVLIRDFDDAEMLEVAIIENVQRADLNAMEEAAGYRQLMDSFGHTQEKLAEALGKSRSHIANTLRLMTLPDEVQTMLRTGQLTAGHARALVTLENPLTLARKIVKDGLSVRDAERLAKAGPEPTAAPKTGAKKPVKDADTRALEDDLAATLKMKVSIEHKPGGEAGRLVISYGSLEQLDNLCGKLTR